MEASIESCVRGFHIYQNVWTPVVGEVLGCRRETTNTEDRYAVAVYKSEEVVGHVPRKISCLCAAFIRRGGAICCTVEGGRRYSSDLLQGGMEIPCKLTFKGPLQELQKVQKYFICAMKSHVHIVNTSSNSPFNKCEAKSVSDSSPATDLDKSKESDSSHPRKHGITKDTVSLGCSKGKRVKFVTVDDVSSSNTATSLNCSEELPLTKKCVTAVEKEKHMVDDESTVTKEVWVQFRRSTLTKEDKLKIGRGHRLTDKHINFASCLISRQFPQIGGLRTTLLQTRYYCFPSQSIQPIFCKGREHWIVASNLGTDECRTVYVYDSVFTELDQETSDLILRMFHNRDNNRNNVTIMMKKSQKQIGSVDCGLFTIAVMTSLAHKEDPSVITYDQKNMRQHL